MEEWKVGRLPSESPEYAIPLEEPKVGFRDDQPNLRATEGTYWVRISRTIGDLMTLDPTVQTRHIFGCDRKQ